MPSLFKTAFLELSKWAGNEYPKREDFVSDNEKIDAFADDISSQMAQFDSYDEFRLSANQSIPNIIETRIEISNQTKSKFCGWDNINKAITFNTTGIFLINVSMAYAGNATGRRQMYIYKGLERKAITMTSALHADASGFQDMNITTIIDIASLTDKIQLRTLQTSGADLNLLNINDMKIQIKLLGGL